ncbi:MAG: peptidase M16 domain-containing protein [Spirochaetes bacterium]|nr:MAG: peptidase M16 domain-containing protein [Spirochaetota bacterium]
MEKNTRRDFVHPCVLRIAAFVLLLFLVLGRSLGAQAQLGGISHRKLPNGLEIFAMRNSSVPLATICVAFRGGAIAHTPETAGLFHLYEHMLFAGNRKYPTKQAFNAALNSMGTTTWNGATGTEYINYHITIPSETLEKGIEFWASAVRSPIFDPQTLENEKSVVLNEIKGYHADPAQIAANALSSRMFPAAPWRKNIDGPEGNIESANVEALRDMQNKFYIPSNMALLVGGDCDPGEVFALAEKYFGDWSGGSAPELGKPAQGPLPEGVRVISIEDSFYRGLAQAQFRWRGPDVLEKPEDTYAADVLLFLMSSPVGRFKKSLMVKVPGLFDPEYIDFSYPTARDGANFIFNTYLVVQNPQSEGSVLDRVESLRLAVMEEFTLMAVDPVEYFSARELEKAKTKLIDQNIYALESVDSFITDTLTFWWSTATADYFFGYEENCAAVGWDSIVSLLRRYILGARPDSSPAQASMVRLRTSTAGTDFKMAGKIEELGYAKATSDTAFWWQRQGGGK